MSDRFEDEFGFPEAVGSDSSERPGQPGGERIALAVRNMRKSYGGAVALEDVSLTVRAGEVHALLGQNGCGKSTLVKSLTGVVAPDSGRVEIYGRWVEPPINDPHRWGIAVIHQDIGLVDSMTVLENLGVATGYGTGLLAPVNVRAQRAAFEAIMARLGIEFDLDAEVSTLSPAERALIAVVRAMRSMDASGTHDRIFILDEPTAALSRPEARRLLDLMRRVADAGSAVVFISHRLAEVMEVCDRATVMRAGRDVIEVAIADTTRADLVAHMLGRRMGEFFPAPPEFSGGPVRIEARELSGERVSKVSLEVHGGEVVGVTGLAGMGQEELPLLLAGAERPRSGSIEVDGVAADFASPADSVAAGIALVPGNRLRDGVWIAGTAEENLTLPVLRGLTGMLGIRRRRVRELAASLMRSVRVHPDRPEHPLAAFSGGNQQKIVFAKWMQTEPGVLLLHEPTQGVDPGAAKQLLEMAMDAAAAGAAVAVFSGDHEQLAAICHRVVILHHGLVVAELTGDDLSEQRILEACESMTPALAAAA